MQEQKFIRLLTRAKRVEDENYYNINVPKDIANLLGLRIGDPMKVYLDNSNKIVVEKLML